MDTMKLYYDDAYLREFDATVLQCEALKDSWLVTLDRTAFYPEGGGQPADHGTLGGAAVTDVHEKGGAVIHTCSAPLEVGSSVHGQIDWQRRFDHMQQHSGEHIVSGMLCAAFHCDNVGFHMGSDIVTIDYNTEMTWEDILAIERQANRYLWENHPFIVTYPSAQELQTLEYRSKKELSGQVRITSFPGADTCACCGTHVSHSGEVGLVKFLSVQKFRSGVRLELLCGQRAMDYLSRNWEENHAVAQSLSVKDSGTFAAVQRLQTELSETKLRAAALEEESFRRTAAEYAGHGDVLLIVPPLQGDGARRLCDAVSQVCGGRCAVFSGEAGSYKYAVIHAGQDIRQSIKDMNSALNGRGGGRDGFAQGSVQATDAQIRAYFE